MVLAKIEAAPDDDSYTERGWFAADAANVQIPDWLSFGHPSRISRDPGQNSERCFFRVTFAFLASKLARVEVRLFLLNPKFRLFEKGYSPARVTKDFVFEGANAGARLQIGLAVDLAMDQAGNRDSEAVFAELEAPIGIDLNENLDPKWKTLEPKEGNLTGRLDLAAIWEDASEDHATRGHPRTAADFAGDPGQRDMSFFLSDGTKGFNGVVHESGRIGLHFDSGQFAKMALVAVLDKPVAPSKKATTGEKQRWEVISTTLREFGLTTDFRGLIFNGLHAHWLDDGAMGADIDVKKSLVALSFAGGDMADRQAIGVYCSCTGEIAKSNQDSFFKFLADEPPAQFKISVANSFVRECALSATFDDDVSAGDPGTNPYMWLKGLSAAFRLKTKPGGGTGPDSYMVDVETDTAKGRPIACLRADDLDLDATTFTFLASVLTFAPIIELAKNNISPSGEGRDNFVSLGVAAELGALFAGAAFKDSYFFKSVITADEMRVTGIRLLSQPAARDAPRETALLFDYETLFNIGTSSPVEFSSKRALSARVENSGISYRSKSSLFSWVQVPKSAFDVKVLDDSIWDFGKFENILGLKGISFGIEKSSVNLGFDLGLNLNLGLLKAGDVRIDFEILRPDLKFKIRPSELSLEIPGILKGLGRLSFGETDGDIGGLLELELLSTGLKCAAEARFAKVQKADNVDVAVAAGASIEFPTGIPLFGSGLQLKGADFLYAQHFVRHEEDVANNGSKSLNWLREAGGIVFGTLTAKGKYSKQPLWVPKYDNWSFGLGALTTLQTDDQLLNLNTMFVYSIPGPTVTVFAKARIFAAPKTNKQAVTESDDISTGILGVLELNFADKLVSYAASVDLDFEKFVKIYGSIDTQFSYQDFTNWHYYVGREDKPVSASLSLGGILDVGATGYVMVSGKDLEVQKLPGSQGGRTLQGLAVAMGARTHGKIGKGGVYLSVFVETLVQVSISKNLYVAGGITLGGELFLFIGGVGLASGLKLEYCDSEDRGKLLSIHGWASGSIKILFSTIRGSVHVRLGDAPPNMIAIPPLVSAVNIVAGTDFALRGQGMDGKIDETLAKLEEGGAIAAGADHVPLDAVLAVSLVAAPSTEDRKSAKGFLGVLGPAATNTEFNYGAKKGGYALKNVSLICKSAPNQDVPVDYAKAKAQWLRNVLASGNQQALPIGLGLLTSRPIGAPNAVPSSEVLKAWIDALNQGLCSVVPAQPSMFFPDPTTIDAEAAPWAQRAMPFSGHFRCRDLQSKLGNASVGTFAITCTNHAPSTSPNRSRIEVKPHQDGVVSFVALYPDWPASDGQEFVFTSEGFSIDVTAGADAPIVELLVACEDVVQLGMNLGIREGSVKVLTADLDKFHEGAEFWQPRSTAFIQLSELAGYGNLTWARVQFVIDPAKVPAEGLPEIRVRWSGFRIDRFDRRTGPMPLYIGAVRFLGHPEIVRHSAERSKSEADKAAIIDYLKPRELVLDPASEYEVAVEWETNGNGIEPGGSQEIYKFKTASAPPLSLRPYLISSYPTDNSQLLPFAHTPGVSIASGALMRLLARWRDLRLKVTVVDETGGRVDSAGGDFDWRDGQKYAPADLLNEITVPVGIDRQFFDGLPSALVRAIREAIAAGRLHCIDTSNLELDSGVWLGINVSLKPLRRYTVRIELTDDDGNVWPTEDGRSKRPVFFEWSFRTGLFADAKGAAQLFRNYAVKRRLLDDLIGKRSESFEGALIAAATPLVVDTEYVAPDILLSDSYTDKIGESSRRPRSNDVVNVVQDQVLEDILASYCGDRFFQLAEAETYLLISPRSADAEPAPHAILLRSREPIMRQTVSAKIAAVEASGPDQPKPADMLELGSFVTRYPRLEGSVGISSIFVSTSGTTVVAFLADADADVDLDHVRLAIHEVAPRYLPFKGVIPETHIEFS